MHVGARAYKVLFGLQGFPCTATSALSRTSIYQFDVLRQLHKHAITSFGNCLYVQTDGVSRDRFLEEEQVLWISLQPRTGLPLKVTPIGA